MIQILPVDTGRKMVMYYATSGERIIPRKPPTAVYYKNGRRFASHWILLRKEVGKFLRVRKKQNKGSNKAK